MKIPVIHGVIDRRILVNYRVDPRAVAPLLPGPFRPQLVDGVALVGICLIRLRHVRPAGLPTWVGVSSENAAHRIAVEWDEAGQSRSGVYIWRRDTNRWLNAMVGGRVFPGVHHHARFTVREIEERCEVALQSDDGRSCVSVRGRRTDRLPPGSVFASLSEASEFFRAGSLGYSATSDPTRHQGLELRCRDWQAEPLEIEEARSSYFDDGGLFPRGALELDCALLMRHVKHEWHGRGDLCTSAANGERRYYRGTCRGEQHFGAIGC